MANEAIANKAPAGNVLAAFLPRKDTKQTQSATETSQTNVTAEGINGIIRTLMEGDTGLAALMQRTQGAGLYNSSTAQLLANDLASRVGEKAAIAGAATTKNATQTTKTNNTGGSIDPKWALGLQLLSELAGKFDNKGGSGGSGGNAGGLLDSVMSLFGSDPKKKSPLDGSNTFADNFVNTGDFQNPNYSLFDPGSSLNFSTPALSSGGGSFASTPSYDPFAGTSFSNTGFNSSNFLGSTPSTGLNVSSNGNGSGISFGFSF
jgi:hypothetical protein